MYFFILEIQIPSKSQDFPGTRFLSSLFFPGMPYHHQLRPKVLQISRQVENISKTDQKLPTDLNSLSVLTEN